MISKTTESFENPIHVLKFGGSSLATPEQVLGAAKTIQEVHSSGKHVVAVVSAMGTTTNELNALAKQVSKNPSRRELDMLVSTGERVSMALISMALNDLGCEAISFTGSQAGLLTEGTHNDARLADIKPIRIVESLKQNKVVVVAGFQGVDPNTKEITTLGRGGSDITAVALAHHFQAEECRFIKDVPGILTVDPKWVKTEEPVSSVPMQALLNACAWGAKVLNPRSLDLAIKYEVPVVLGSSVIDPRIEGEKAPFFLSVHSVVFELNQSHLESLNQAWSTGELVAPLHKCEEGENIYLVLHPDHKPYYESFFEASGKDRLHLQCCTVVYGKATALEPEFLDKMERILEPHLHSQSVRNDGWTLRLSEEANLQDCAEKIFKEVW